MSVVYSSRGGNRECFAQAVAEGVKSVKGTEVGLKKAQDVTNSLLREVNALIVGFPVYLGCMSSEVNEMFDKSVGIRGDLEGKLGTAFTTSPHPIGRKETTML